mmetsp:Transcript_20694/g.41012  ORF Transcript_20694/g.41012 Transcript_20694/m.41012 type:complete len:433 (+) Transcript_20694:3-1301(+)
MGRLGRTPISKHRRRGPAASDDRRAFRRFGGASLQRRGRSSRGGRRRRRHRENLPLATFLGHLHRRGRRVVKSPFGGVRFRNRRERGVRGIGGGRFRRRRRRRRLRRRRARRVRRRGLRGVRPPARNHRRGRNDDRRTPSRHRHGGALLPSPVGRRRPFPQTRGAPAHSGFGPLRAPRPVPRRRFRELRFHHGGVSLPFHRGVGVRSARSFSAGVGGGTRTDGGDSPSHPRRRPFGRRKRRFGSVVSRRGRPRHQIPFAVLLPSISGAHSRRRSQSPLRRQIGGPSVDFVVFVGRSFRGGGSRFRFHRQQRQCRRKSRRRQDGDDGPARQRHGRLERKTQMARRLRQIPPARRGLQKGIRDGKDEIERSRRNDRGRGSDALGVSAMLDRNGRRCGQGRGRGLRVSSGGRGGPRGDVGRRGRSSPTMGRLAEA